jgi:hypothetical protein
MRKSLLPLLGVSATLLVLAPAASADDTPCVGFMPPATYDNLVVPEGQFCVLSNSLVRGNIKALPNSDLFADSNEIRGNVEGDKARQIQVTDSPITPAPSIVRGNVQATEGNTHAIVCGTELPGGNIEIQKFGPSSFIAIGDDVLCSTLGGGNTLAKGSIKVEENVIGGPGLGIDNNTVGQNLQVLNNTGSGNKTVNGNTGGGDLQCFGNSPPFNGSGNNFPKEEGQCN